MPRAKTDSFIAEFPLQTTAAEAKILVHPAAGRGAHLQCGAR
ncbi:MAG TPA: hypothetical protein VMK12_29210 [Anaeromyxobacteraceae bacterium]|nr:hypothetical protein [Anaeromyxobacteraceae bacterium]